MLIDFHTHCFPDSLAPRAVESLAKKSGIMFPPGCGTVKSLLGSMESSAVDYSVVLGIATNPRQQRKVNDFAISLLNEEKLIPFGSVHPDSEDALTELERLAANGIKGIKFHPEYQSFFVDEKRMFPIYEKAASLGLITVFHAGIDLGYRPPFRSTPERLKNILPVFGGAPVVAAHFGGVNEVYDTLHYLCGTDIYFDTAYSYGAVSPLAVRDILNSHPAEKVLFGTDFPWMDAKMISAFLDCCELSGDEREKITGGNARRLLGL